jgi:hypothetical protein
MFALSTLALLVLLSGIALSQSGTCSGMSLGQGASLNGFLPFQAGSLWNTDVSATPVDPNSTNIINFIGSTITLHPDFGAGTFHNQTLGIPYQIVSGRKRVPVTLGLYFDESDQARTDLPVLIEGYRNPVMATATCLY